jgi:uncharacterized protein (DUF4415 family)
MNDERTVRRTLRERGPDKTDWDRIEKLTDAEIEKAISEDPDAAPLLDEEWFRGARLVLPDGRERVSIDLDAEVAAYFRALGQESRDRISAVLRDYVKRQAKA